MSRAAICIFLATAFSFEAFPQLTFPSRSAQNPGTSGWPSGYPRDRVSFEGLLARSDGETLSVELRDQRVIRFRLDERTRLKPDRSPEKLTSFHITDVVGVEAEVDAKGYLMARSVHFIRKASPDEQAEILQSPELMQPGRENVLDSNGVDLPGDDRRLSLVVKPMAIADREEDTVPSLRPTESGDLVPLIRRTVNEAFNRLPNFRAKQVTSLFHSASKPIKWIPDSVVTTEIAYEDDHESYSDIRIDGKRPANAPPTGDSEFMRSLDKAWSTGDFKTISHCVFSELADSDFRRVRTEHGSEGELVVYEFTGARSSSCVGVRFKSQIAYPAYKGLMKVTAQNREILHVELEATGMPTAFPLDRAERSVDFGMVRIGGEQYLVPTTAYWFGCIRNTYSCFLNRMDFRDYRRFEADSVVRFSN